VAKVGHGISRDLGGGLFNQHSIYGR